MLATYSLTYLTLPPNLLSQSKIFISHAHAKTETGFIDSPGPCAYRQDGEGETPHACAACTLHCTCTYNAHAHAHAHAPRAHCTHCTALAPSRSTAAPHHSWAGWAAPPLTASPHCLPPLPPPTASPHCLPSLPPLTASPHCIHTAHSPCTYYALAMHFLCTYFLCTSHACRLHGLPGLLSLAQHSQLPHGHERALLPRQGLLTLTLTPTLTPTPTLTLTITLTLTPNPKP